MQGLTPIDVETYERYFKLISQNLEKASDLLIPDAYETEKQQLMTAKSFVDKHFTGFNEVLNYCSAGVIFAESFIPNTSVETNINNTVTGLLWSSEYMIDKITKFNTDLSLYISNLSVTDAMVWKMDQLVLAEKKFNFIVEDLEECSKIILSVLTKLDGYNI